MSSIPRDALKTKASKPGVIGVPSSRLSASARAITSCGSEISAGVILFITSAAVYPSMRSAPTLKIWMTPVASVAMLEKLALLKIALCNAPVRSSASLCPVSAASSTVTRDLCMRATRAGDEPRFQVTLPLDLERTTLLESERLAEQTPRTLRDLHASGDAVRFHPACCIHGITPYVIDIHALADDTGNHRARRDPDPRLQRVPAEHVEVLQRF